jgi:predicted GTPase
MKIGAGVVAARKFGAAELVDPRPFTVGKLTETFEKYPNIGTLLPAMGYGEQQLRDLETTINNTDCDAVVIGTPIDLNRIIISRDPQQGSGMIFRRSAARTSRRLLMSL